MAVNNPATAVDSKVVEAMREMFTDIGGNKPKALTLEMVEQKDKRQDKGKGSKSSEGDGGRIWVISFKWARPLN